MMGRSIFQLFFCFVILYSTVEGYVAIAYPEEKPADFANEPGCYVSSFGRVLETGKPYSPPGKCEQYTCHSDESVHITGCGAIGISAGCELVAGNKQLPYPKCCDAVKCREPNGDYIVLSPYKQ